MSCILIKINIYSRRRRTEREREEKIKRMKDDEETADGDMPSHGDRSSCHDSYINLSFFYLHLFLEAILSFC